MLTPMATLSTTRRRLQPLPQPQPAAARATITTKMALRTATPTPMVARKRILSQLGAEASQLSRKFSVPASVAYTNRTTPMPTLTRPRPRRTPCGGTPADTLTITVTTRRICTLWGICTAAEVAAGLTSITISMATIPTEGPTTERIICTMFTRRYHCPPSGSGRRGEEVEEGTTPPSASRCARWVQQVVTTTTATGPMRIAVCIMALQTARITWRCRRLLLQATTTFRTTMAPTLQRARQPAGRAAMVPAGPSPHLHVRTPAALRRHQPI